MSSTSSKDLKNFLEKLKKDLQKSEQSSLTFSSFCFHDIFSSRDRFFQFFFSPLLKKTKDLKVIFEKEKKCKKLIDKPLHEMINFITNWYFTKNMEKFGLKYKMEYKFRDFLRFVDQLQNEEYGIPVKLVISKFSEKASFFNNLYCCIKTDFGSNHIGLQVGPYIIDWNSSSIVNIRPLKVQNCIIVLDLVVIREKQEKFYKMICDIIWDWNVRYVYNYRPREMDDVIETKEGNCHAFVEYTLDKISKEFIPCSPNSVYSNNGPVMHFLNYCKKWDQRGRQIFRRLMNFDKANESFLSVKREKKYSKYGPSYANFKSHAEFDKACLNILEVKKTEDLRSIKNPKRIEIFSLLKGFDRAFWFENNENELFNYRKCPLIKAKCGQFSMVRSTVGENLMNGRKENEEEKKLRIEKEKKKDEELYQNFMKNCEGFEELIGNL